MKCQNCIKETGERALVDGLCDFCHGEMDKAPKMTDRINNSLEAAGMGLRFTEEQVRQAILLNARAGRKAEE